jgi:branched-chain amino acid transport system substrate-binding protein
MPQFRFMPQRLLVAVIVAGALALASGSAAEEPFEIYTIEPLTGPAGFIGSSTAKTLAAAEDLVNRTGGIKGRPLKFVISDDQTNPQVAVQIMSQYLAKKPSIVIAGMIASLCNAPAGLLKADGPVLWCYTPAVHPPAGSWIFSTGYSTDDYFRAGLTYFRGLNFTKIAIMTSTDATGQDADRGITEALAKPENRSLTAVAREHFAGSDITVSAQLERIRASGAQGLLLWTSGTPFGTVLRGLQQAGMTIPVIGAPSNLIYAQLNSFAPVWPNEPVLFFGFPALVPDSTKDRRVRFAVNQFLDAMKAAKIDHPDLGEAFAWDNLMIVVDAYRKFGTSATPAQIRDYINGVRGRGGVFGMLDFQENPQRGVLPEWITLVRWDPAKGQFFAASKPGGAPL